MTQNIHAGCVFPSCRYRHFILWVNTHRHIKEFFVEERTRASTPQADIALLARAQSYYAGPAVYAPSLHAVLWHSVLVEVEITAKHFIRTFTGQHHLMPIALILRDIKYIGVEARIWSHHKFRCGKSRRGWHPDLPYSEVNFVMHRAQMVCHFLGSFRSGEPGRPTAKECNCGHQLQSVPDLPRDGRRISW